MSKTNYHEDAVLNTARGTDLTAWTPYVGLLTAVSDGEASSFTEVTGNNYSRKAVTFNAPSGGTMTNDGLITFDTPSGNWGTITHFIIADASSGGNTRYWNTVSAQQVVNTGNVVTIADEALSVTEG